MLTEQVQRQRRASVENAVPSAYDDQRVCSLTTRFAAASGFVFESNLLHKRQTVGLAHGPYALGIVFAARQRAGFGHTAQVIDDGEQARDRDAEGGQVV